MTSAEERRESTVKTRFLGKEVPCNLLVLTETSPELTRNALNCGQQLPQRKTSDLKNSH